MKYIPYSFSKLNLYLQCPKKFKFMLRGTVPIEGFYLDKGSLFHEIIECKLSNRPLNKTDQDYKYLSKKDFKFIYEAAQKFQETDFFKLVSNKKKYLIEEWCNFEQNLTPKKGPGLLNGKIDYACFGDKIGMIVDWKTGGKSVESLKRFPKDLLQLQIYALWALQKFETLDRVHCIFSFVEHDHQQVETFVQNDVPIIRSIIMDLINKIENDKEFKCQLGPLCNFCDFRSECPEFKVNV